MPGPFVRDDGEIDLNKDGLKWIGIKSDASIAALLTTEGSFMETFEFVILLRYSVLVLVLCVAERKG